MAHLIAGSPCAGLSPTLLDRHDRTVRGNMKRLFVTALCVVALSALTVIGIKANTEGCKDAIDEYNSARSDIADTIKRYASCVGNSDGHDDCSSEFRRLKSAQDDSETAVSDYEGECQ